MVVWAGIELTSFTIPIAPMKLYFGFWTSTAGVNEHLCGAELLAGVKPQHQGTEDQN